MISQRMTLKQRLEGCEWRSVALWGEAQGPRDLRAPPCARRQVVEVSAAGSMVGHMVRERMGCPAGVWHIRFVQHGPSLSPQYQHHG